MSEPKDDAEAKPSEVMDIRALDTYSLLSLFIRLLTEKAWQTMGLRTKPGTDKIEADLEQAREAIDTAAFLAEKVQPHLPDVEKQRLKSMVADLKLNYVRLTETQKK